jgi:aspartate/glutamate racemase
MSSHIGIVACSAEGAALCYRTICSEGSHIWGPHGHPEVSMHTFPLSTYMARIEADDWEGVGELMLSSAHKLATVGAEFLICPDNTIHQAMGHVQQLSPLPWLHIAEVVASEAVTHGYHRIGLMGTRWLVESDVYPEQFRKHGLEWFRPDASERQEVNRIILRSALTARGLAGGLDQRYRLTTAHMTLVRFANPLRNARRFVGLLERFRDAEIGTWRVAQLELVLGDWYQSRENEQRIAAYSMGQAAPATR